MKLFAAGQCEAHLGTTAAEVEFQWNEGKSLPFHGPDEPTNLALRTRAEEVVRLVEQKRPTIPTTIQQEKSYNPFLRADLRSVADAIGMEGVPPAQVFAAIRSRKDKF